MIPAQSLDFLLPEPTGSITLMAARLQYYKNGNSPVYVIDDVAWMPAGVIHARYE